MCGIAGIFSRTPVPLVESLHDMMIMLQHRGHEAAGAGFYDEVKWHPGRRIAVTGNSVAHFFKKFEKEGLKGTIAGAHTRYSTAGGAENLNNVQPFFVNTKFGEIGIAHNGTLVKAPNLKGGLLRNNIMHSDSDTEVILHMIAMSDKPTLKEAIVQSLESVGGAYALLIFTDDYIIAARDQFGFRPLSIAEFDGGYLVASETCAFDTLKQKSRAVFIRDVEPGEVVLIDQYGPSTLAKFESKRIAQCIFELIYFARPDSFMFGRPVDEFREITGIKHAVDYPTKVDCVIAIPDSSNHFADGRAIGLNVRHERAIVRNHSTGRTFIDPNQQTRSKNVRLKLNPIPRRIKGKRVDICDDSIVRGNTSRKVINMLKGCDPEFISFSLGSPPVKHPCLYGIDTPTEKELIAAQKSIPEIAQSLGVDSLNYLSLERLKEIGGCDFCYACFDGDYPLK